MDHVAQLQLGGGAGQRDGEQALRIGLLEQDDAPSARLERAGRRDHAVAQGRCLGTFGVAAGAEDRLQAQRLGRLATEHDRGGEVLEGELVRGRSGGRRRQHQIDAVGGEVLPDHRRPGAQPEDVGGSHASQLAEVGGEARPVPVAEPADRRPNRLEGLFEGVPHVHLALVAARRLAYVAAADPQRGDAAGIAVQPARGQEAGGQRQLHDGHHGGVAQLGVDLGQDRVQGVQVARACRGRAARRPGPRGRRGPGIWRAAPGTRGSGGRPGRQRPARTPDVRSRRSEGARPSSSADRRPAAPEAGPRPRRWPERARRPRCRRARQGRWHRGSAWPLSVSVASISSRSPASRSMPSLARSPSSTGAERSSGPPRFRSQAGQR